MRGVRQYEVPRTLQYCPRTVPVRSAAYGGALVHTGTPGTVKPGYNDIGYSETVRVTVQRYNPRGSKVS